MYSLGLALGWLFSSSVFVNNSVKVVSNAFDFEKDQCEDERNVRRQSLKILKKIYFFCSSILVLRMPKENIK